MIRDERRSTVHMSETDREYLEQTLFTMTIINKTWNWILKMIPLRAWVVALLFLCIMVTTFTRYNVILAVVTMTVDLNQGSENSNISDSHICPPPEKFHSWIDIELPGHKDVNLTELDFDEHGSTFIPDDDNDDDGIKLRDKVYAWSASTQGNIFGAFFWSYFACMVPAGLFAGKIGGRLLISVCILGCALISCNIPLVTDHVMALIVMRFILGLLHAPIFPAAFAIICNWIPVEERSVCFALLDVAVNSGAILVFIASGWVNDLWGWPALYFIPGLMAMMVFFLAIICIRDKPDEDLQSLENGSVEDLKKDKSVKQVDVEPPPKPILPIKEIIFNPAVASCGLFKFACFYNVNIIGSKVPTYLKIILHQDLSSNGYTNAVIYGLIAISLTVSGALSDQIINRGILSRTRCRKAFSLVSGFGVALSLLLIPAAGCCPYKLHLVLFLNSICCGFMAGSDVPLPSEMSTHFPAELYAILNTIAMASGFVAPGFAGFFLDAMDDQWGAWCIVYWSSAVLLIIATIVFLLFASAERQPFDFQEESKNSQSKDEKMSCKNN